MKRTTAEAEDGGYYVSVAISYQLIAVIRITK